MLWLVIVLILLSAAVVLVRTAFRIGGLNTPATRVGGEPPFQDVLFYVLGAATMVALPAMFAGKLLRRRIRTGHWMLTSPETLGRLGRLNTRPRGWRQASPWTWARFVFAWAGFVAFHRASAWWKRAAGWVLLAAYAALLAVFTWFSLVCIAAGAETVATGGYLLLLLGAGLLVWPGVTVHGIIRRLRAGGLRITDAEIDRIRADRNAWRQRESLRPLHTKVVATIFLLTIYSLWWLRVTVYHAAHPHEGRLTPALWTPFVLYSIWAQFAKAPVSSAEVSEPAGYGRG